VANMHNFYLSELNKSFHLSGYFIILSKSFCKETLSSGCCTIHHNFTGNVCTLPEPTFWQNAPKCITRRIQYQESKS